MMRTFNRIITLVLGLLLIAGGVLIAIEAALAAFHKGPWLVSPRRWYDALASTQLTGRSVLAAATAIGLAGLALLVAELRHWPPYRLPAHPGAAEANTEWWVLRGPAERRLAHAAAKVPGVRTARVRLRGGRRWKVYVRAEARPDSGTEIQEVIEAELARLAAPAPAQVRVRLRNPRRVT